MLLSPNKDFFLWIPGSAADDAEVNPNEIKTALYFTINCTILDNWVFDNFTLLDELFAKGLQSFETCLSGNNNSSGKLVLY